MKLESITDLYKLPSVIDVDEANLLLIDLVEVIRGSDITPIKGAEAINDLISHIGYRKRAISSKATEAVMQWTEETYDRRDNELIKWHMANVICMPRKEAISFLQKRLELSITSFERKEVTDILAEIGV